MLPRHLNIEVHGNGCALKKTIQIVLDTDMEMDEKLHIYIFYQCSFGAHSTVSSVYIWRCSWWQSLNNSDPKTKPRGTPHSCFWSNVGNLTLWENLKRVSVVINMWCSTAANALLILRKFHILDLVLKGGLCYVFKKSDSRLGEIWALSGIMLTNAVRVMLTES